MADTASKHIDMTTGSLWRNIPLFKPHRHGHYR